MGYLFYFFMPFFFLFFFFFFLWITIFWWLAMWWVMGILFPPNSVGRESLLIYKEKQYPHVCYLGMTIFLFLQGSKIVSPILFLKQEKCSITTHFLRFLGKFKANIFKSVDVMSSMRVWCHVSCLRALFSLLLIVSLLFDFSLVELDSAWTWELSFSQSSLVFY